ncbi:LAGLIDADG family homing endonuclease [Streptomyces sp. NPDC050636]|uniref:LAGLIDADG family homing endonuclease n=1 Tax=Streptomyces sp. NPDC050636 TaxID=3154510 RepID=UPI003438E664
MSTPPVPKLRTRKPTGIVPWPKLLVEGEEKAGKAQPLDALVATPLGWTPMGQLQPGAEVIGSGGQTTIVTAVHDRGMLPIYRVTTSDGASTEVAGDHLWRVWTTRDRHRQKNGRRVSHLGRVITTDEIRERLTHGEVMHLPMVGPVHYAPNRVDLPIGPYLLGLLLGDGGMTPVSAVLFASGDEELHDAVEAALPPSDRLKRAADGVCARITGGSTLAHLKSLGLHGKRSEEKFIPTQYLRANTQDRLALLRGLMDTDGGMERAASTYSTSSPALAADLRELVESLGGTASTRTKATWYRRPDGERREGLVSHRLRVRLPQGECPFALQRKVEQWQRTRPSFTTGPIRTVAEVTFIGHKEARCIEVAADDHLYVTEHFLVTHNSYVAAQFTGSQLTGQAFWLELGEDTADEYAQVPGADYLLVDHNGSYRDILDQIEAVHAEAKRAAAAKEPPVVLVIDSVSLLWRMLVNWTNDRARRSKTGQRKLRQDPDAEVKPSMNLWNDAYERWAKVMYLVRTMPGIVLLLARGKEVAAVDGNGDPVQNTKDWRVEGHKSLAYDATVWVRLRRDSEPQIIGARSLKFQVLREGQPKSVPDFSIEKLVFGLMGCSIHTQPRATPELTGDLAQVWLPKVTAAAKDGVDGLKQLWREVEADKDLSHEEIRVVRADIERRAAELKKPEKLSDPTSDAARLRAAAQQDADAAEVEAPPGDDFAAA